MRGGVNSKSCNAVAPGDLGICRLPAQGPKERKLCLLLRVPLLCMKTKDRLSLTIAYAEPIGVVCCVNLENGNAENVEKSVSYVLHLLGVNYFQLLH